MGDRVLNARNRALAARRLALRGSIALAALALAAPPAFAQAAADETGDLLNLVEGLPFGVEIAGVLVALAALVPAVIKLVRAIQAKRSSK